MLSTSGIHEPGNRGAGQIFILVTLSLFCATLAQASSCISVLDNGSTPGAFIASSTASLSAPNCVIRVNSTHSLAFEASGISTLSAAQFAVNGGYNNSGDSTISPSPTTGAGIVADPYANLPAPNVSATCDQTSYSLAGSSTDSISPGVYCGGISVSGSAQLTLNPGVYILNGGGFNVSGTANITGNNVMFFLTGQNGYTNAPLNFSGSATVTLSAPASGPYQWILFYQDRSAPYQQSNVIEATGLSRCAGAFYFPSTRMVVSRTTLTGQVEIVVWDLTVQDGASLQITGW